MKKIFLLLITISSLIIADGNILNLTKKDIQYIKVNPQKIKIIKRIQNYKELKTDILKNKKNYSTLKQLSRVNSFFNNILSKDDKLSSNTTDNWATRKEFIIKGYGDCEDYAISKYFTLKELGFNPKKLYMIVVKIKSSTDFHMILGYFETNKSIPLILDNLSFKVLPIDKRTNMEVIFAFNEFDAYLMKNNKLSEKTNINWGKTNKWQELLDKVYKK